MYSISKLKNNFTKVEIRSIFRDHPQFPSYIVEILYFSNDGSSFRSKRQWSKSTIDNAEKLHQELALRLVTKGYDLLSSTVK